MPGKMQKGELRPARYDPLVKYWISRGANPSLKRNTRNAVNGGGSFSGK